MAIVDSEGMLLGILTDGDIRRALLRDVQELDSAINKTPATALESDSRASILNRLRKTHRKHMPVVDAVGRYKYCVSLHDDDFNTKPNWVVIMAGGLGVRLGELTKNTPKPIFL